MLASEPPSSRIHTGGGGISVRVNGTTVDSAQPSVDGSVERLSGNVASKDKTVNSSEWAKATITWRTGAQRFSDGSFNIQQHNNNSTASSSIDINGTSPTPQLVHVIRVKSSQDDVLTSSENMEQNGNVASTPVSSAKIRISSSPCISKTVDYSKDKISVVVGSSVNHIIKGEDERSSSGASSAPGSDCERSDSDREADDGTDSGFSPSRRHCARVSVRTNNANNHSSLTSDSFSGDSNAMKNNGVVCNGKGNNVRLTIASYSDKESETKNGVLSDSDPWDMHFHLRELDNAPEDKKVDTEDVQTKIATAHALLAGNCDGTFTLKNRVKSSINSLLQSKSNRNYDQEEVGRIVFYTTSMGIVRTTFERCRKVRKILETLMVKFEERDVFMNKGFQQEVRERLGLTRVIVPQVFVEGRHLGGAEVIEQLNEIGHLRELVRPYKKQSVGGICQQCGGYRYLLCPVCGGSKKSVTHRHHFSEDLVALRCVTCDESGLIRCQQCITGEV
ncbi:Glutaredoxin domain-containing cysteine-rich protein CG12206 [Araneus ventricosus]|uniref:Glutaredoxin domain-containing cysteine-rich protein CG12206 n=1 Tax=Araneus ventricosus TaxID=182803 RepID=A0A4Y1ZYU3_ARAVE|nr:Glutaredoxin domain-containing cysteine-rich protein CG12206 [Araneus ventricosus]